MLIMLIIILIIVLSGWIFMKQPSFGAMPHGIRLKRIQASSNFRKGQFMNLHDTPALTEGETYAGVIKRFFFGSKPGNKPVNKIPYVKTNLHTLDIKKDLVIWFGHSSYFLQVNQNRILVDPVFSGNASPLSFTTRSFRGANDYDWDDIPALDYIFITHDHWDHLDYKTIIALKPKVKKIITSLGVGAHLERWGFHKEMILEMDWMDSKCDNDFNIFCTPARHFSGRGFKRNGSLWSSFVIAAGSRKVYLGGDSGYDDHFKKIGDTHGPFDLAILENGQYDKAWKYIHMMPEEVVQASIDLNAKFLLPVHWAKFPLGIHAWDDPILRITQAATHNKVALIHPLIGEVVEFDNMDRKFEDWWKGL